MKEIQISELPSDHPFKKYWESPDKLERRGWTFFFDGTLWIREKKSEKLMRHWTATGCCGVSVFLREIKFVPDNEPDIACICGNKEFRLSYGSYSISALCKCGAEEQVYSG